MIMYGDGCLFSGGGGHEEFEHPEMSDLED